MRPAELSAYLDSGRTPLLLDVREPWEYEVCKLAGSTLVPMRDLPARAAEFAPHTEIVVICHHGVRSYHAARYLETLGFSDIVNLSGGVAAWADEVDPTMPRY